MFLPMARVAITAGVDDLLEWMASIDDFLEFPAPTSSTRTRTSSTRTVASPAMIVLLRVTRPHGI